MSVQSFLKLLAAASILSLTACSQPATNKTSTNSNSSDGIIGGQPVLAKSELSQSIVGIFDAGKGAICTGSLLPNNIVLTAAHCIGPDSSKMFIVFDVDMISTLQTLDPAVLRRVLRPVTSAVVHSGWDNGSQAADWHDIALIKFAGKLPEGFKPAEFLANANELQVDGEVTLAGYGVDSAVINPVDPKTVPNLEEAISNEEIFCSTDRTECITLKTSGSGLLRSVTVNIAKILDTEVALDQTKGRGACSGDSGGPAYVVKNGKFFLWGITSRGTLGCNATATYTNALTYTDWMKVTIPLLK